MPITYRMRLGRTFAPSADVREAVGTLDEYFHAEPAGVPQNEWRAARRPYGALRAR